MLRNVQTKCSYNLICKRKRNENGSTLSLSFLSFQPSVVAFHLKSTHMREREREREREDQISHENFSRIKTEMRVRVFFLHHESNESKSDFGLAKALASFLKFNSSSIYCP